MISPPPLPTRWGLVPALAPIVSTMAAQARAEHEALRALARRNRLQVHEVAGLVELDAEELEAAGDLVELLPTVPALAEAPAAAELVRPPPLPSRAVAGGRGPGSTKVRAIGRAEGFRGRAMRPRWHEGKRRDREATPAPVAPVERRAARRRPRARVPELLSTYRAALAPAGMPPVGVRAEPLERAPVVRGGRSQDRPGKRASAPTMKGQPQAGPNLLAHEPISPRSGRAPPGPAALPERRAAR